MLTHLHIRNFAIVDELILDIAGGMTVLTGETGAGKSILLDALNLALGDRAESGSVRHGADRAEISVSFDLEDNPHARNWLQEQSLEQEHECLIRRVISQEGRSKGYINGSPVPMASLRELGERLVDIHGQHEHQSLLKTDIQRQLLDDFAGNHSVLDELAQLHEQYKSRRQALDQLQQSAQERQDRVELLSYQVDELDKLALSTEEIDALADEQARLANSEKIRLTVEQVLFELSEAEQQNIEDHLGRLIGLLSDVSQYDNKLSELVSLLNESMVQIQEAGSDLRNHLDSQEADPARLSEVEERLGIIHDLARKHHAKPEALPELFIQLSEELTQLKTADNDLAGLEHELQALLEQYQKVANKLSRQRQQAADKLNREVTGVLNELGMPAMAFSTQLEQNNKDTTSPYGYEQVEFMISPNPGQPAKPLRKIASGGELSRISLAIQTILAHNTHIPTLIYDEVDSGIGGPTAEIVGRKLKGLGDTRQVLCVTHLAQVAAQAHQHIQVSKSSDGKVTTSRVKTLNEQERVEETARMLGGVELTEQSLSHAREMLTSGKQSGSPRKGKTRKRA